MANTRPEVSTAAHRTSDFSRSQVLRTATRPRPKAIGGRRRSKIRQLSLWVFLIKIESACQLHGGMRVKRKAFIGHHAFDDPEIPARHPGKALYGILVIAGGLYLRVPRPQHDCSDASVQHCAQAHRTW